MTLDVDEFKKYLRVDKHRLDDELVQQPSLLFEVSEALTEAIDSRDALKNDLTVVEAEEDKRFRKEFDDAEEKYTEGTIKAKIMTSKRRQAVHKQFAAAKALADQLNALKEAFLARGYAIRDLCQLHVANYFQETSVRSDAATDAVMYQRNRRKIAERRADQK